MSSVTRAFAWRATRQGASYEPESTEFFREDYVATLQAGGPMVSRGQHLAALEVLDGEVGKWLTINWHGACLVAEADQAPRGAHKIWRSYSTPTAEFLGNYLLSLVCEPLLRNRGLLVHAVTLKIGCISHPPCLLEEQEMEAYLREQSASCAPMAQ